MKKIVFSLLALLTLNAFSQSSNYQAGDEVTISQDQSGNQYLAGENVEINAKVHGDVVAGAAQIKINDSIFDDLLLGAGEVHVNAYVGDDARISGGEIDINSPIDGDLIVFGGQIELSKEASVKGDVVVYGGQVTVSGDVGGSLRCAGGQIDVSSNIGGDVSIQGGKVEFTGSAEGNMRVAGKDLEFGENARCMGELRYWSEEGEMDLSHVSDNAVFDEDLAIVEQEMDWGILAAMAGMGIIAYWIIFVLSTFMVLLLLQHFFGKFFEQAAQTVTEKFVLSFGYGMLYFVIVPVLSVLMFIIIIGFPIGVLTLSLYLITLLFVASITGLTVAHYFKLRYNQNWTYFATVGYALITVIVLKVIFWIPVLGGLLKILLASASYGAFILMITKSLKKAKEA